MGNAAAQDILDSYKRVFLRGLGTVLPTILTLWLLLTAFQFVDEYIARPISDGIKTRLVTTEWGNELIFEGWPSLEYLRRAEPSPPPPDADQAAVARHFRQERERILAAEAQRQADLRRELDARFPKWVGFLLAIVAVFVVGFFMASFLGSWLWGLFEGWVHRIPLVKNIYPGFKQMVDFLLRTGDGAEGFQSVVACEFPRRGQWSIGFLTSENVPEIETHASERVRGVYMGTPAAGQVILVPESEIIPIDMTVDEALKFNLSGGVIGRDPDRSPMLSAGAVKGAVAEGPPGGRDEEA